MTTVEYVVNCHSDWFHCIFIYTLQIQTLYGSQKNTSIGCSNLWLVSKSSAGLDSTHPGGTIRASDIYISTVNILYWRENVRALHRKLFQSFIVKKEISAALFSTLLNFFMNDSKNIE